MTDSTPYTIRFLSKQKLAKDTFVFHFERPNRFDFLPGQYNRWTLPITATDGRGSSRFFTISSSPLEKTNISLTTKIIQSDFKKALLQLKKNDEIKIFGPMGNFVFHEADSNPKVLIAGGIGITPFHSMFTYAAEKNLTIPITLLVSFSTPDEIIYFDELKKCESEHPNLKIAYTITKPEASKTPWTAEIGRISQDLIKKYVPDITNSLFYVVGPPPMEEATTKLLKEIHIAEDHIITEQFTGY